MAAIASLVEPSKLNADVSGLTRRYVTRIVEGHPQSQIDDLMPWEYAATQLKALA